MNEVTVAIVRSGDGCWRLMSWRAIAMMDGDVKLIAKEIPMRDWFDDIV